MMHVKRAAINADSQVLNCKQSCPNENQINKVTVMILSFRIDRSGQTVQTQIRLLLVEEQTAPRGGVV